MISGNADSPTPVIVRPDLLGLTRAKATLNRILNRGSGVHSVLLYGAEGSGKSELANWLVRLWLSRDGTPYADDQASQAFDRGTNPDVLKIAPMGPSAIIRTQQLTESSEKSDEPILPMSVFLRTLPLMSRHKVVLIEDAHRMNDSSSNSLLKPLEEPHAYAKIILTTTSISSIRPTILSRCIAIACDLPSELEMESAFAATPGPIRQMAEGSPGKTYQFAAHPERYLELAAFLDSLVDATPLDVLRLSETFRQICEKIGVTKEFAARASHAHTLSVSATYLAHNGAVPPEWVHKFIEAHRLILQNGSATLVFDTLFSSLFLM